MIASMEDGERDWENLPPEMLELIAKKLPPDIPYFISFRAVCKTWRSSAPVSIYRPQLPWILKYPNNEASPSMHFCDWFLNGDTYKIHSFDSPEYIDCLNRLCHHHFYVLGYDRGHKYSLWNPITNKHIDLGRSERYIKLCAIGPDPGGNGEYLILSICEPENECCCISFRRLAEPENILFKIENNNHIACLYYNGEFFYIEISRITKVIDIATKKLAYEMPPATIDTLEPLDFIHLVESDGEILLVFKIWRQRKIDIYKLNLTNGRSHARWVKIDSIGDRVLFMDWYKCLSFRFDDWATIERNYIYILNSPYLYIYDITNHLPYEVTDPFFNGDTVWYIPSLW